MAQLTLKATAKVNLFLEVLRKRPDDYHDIETILQEIDLADTITLKETRSPDIVIRSNNPHIPTDNTNLAFKAAAIFKRYIGERNRGIIIEIKKCIPVASGLGGGSSDAAATLKGLNSLWKINLGRNILLGLAEKIGMDCPFFIQGGLCLAEGRGEKIFPIAYHPEIWFAMVIPPIMVSTAWVYSQLSISPLTRKRKENRIMLKAIKASDVGKIGRQLFNRLEEVTITKHRVIGELKEAMIYLGANGALMSGSGPAVFGVFPTRQEAYRIRDKLVKNKEEVYVAKSR